LPRFARQKLNARAGKNSFPLTPFLFARLIQTTAKADAAAKKSKKETAKF